MFTENCLLDPLPLFPPRAGEWGYWVPQLIPFASWDAYDLCVHAESGDVWEFIPNCGLIRHRQSVAAVLREVIDAVRSGREPQLGRCAVRRKWTNPVAAIPTGFLRFSPGRPKPRGRWLQSLLRFPWT
jgi:hypothetical protein